MRQGVAQPLATPKSVYSVYVYIAHIQDMIYRRLPNKDSLLIVLLHGGLHGGPGQAPNRLPKTCSSPLHISPFSSPFHPQSIPFRSALPHSAPVHENSFYFYAYIDMHTHMQYSYYRYQYANEKESPCLLPLNTSDLGVQETKFF